jgi:hypothetical protein
MRDQDEADSSKSTAEFRAFVNERQGADATQAWTMNAHRNQVVKLVAIAVVVAVVIAIIAFVVIG